MKRKFKNFFNFHVSFWAFSVLALIILISLFINIVVNSKTNAVLNKKIAQAEELARPADIDIIILKDSSCEDCFNVEQLLEAVKKENVKVNSEKTVEANSLEGAELIAQFSINKIPTFIITGEIEKNASLNALWPKIGEISGNSFVLKQIPPPYILTDSGEVKGRGEFIMLWVPDCQECYDVTEHEIVLNRFGFTQEGQIISAESDKGKELITKYNIELLPTIILSGDIDTYGSLKSIWPSVGTIEEDGTYIFRQGVKQMGIYKDLSTGEIINPSESLNN